MFEKIVVAEYCRAMRAREEGSLFRAVSIARFPLAKRGKSRCAGFLISIATVFLPQI